MNRSFYRGLWIALLITSVVFILYMAVLQLIDLFGGNEIVGEVGKSVARNT